METKTDEVVDGIYRFSTFIPEVGIVFNQYLVTADEPLLFHTGMRGLFPLVSEAVGARDAARTAALDLVRPLRGRRVRCDERLDGGRARRAGRAHRDRRDGVGRRSGDAVRRVRCRTARCSTSAASGCATSTRRTSRTRWDAGLLYEETTNTLFCGDLFGALGDGPVVSSDDPVGPAMEAEAAFHPLVDHAVDGPDDPPARCARAVGARDDARARVRRRRRATRSSGWPTNTRGCSRGGHESSPNELERTQRSARCSNAYCERLDAGDFDGVADLFRARRVPLAARHEPRSVRPPCGASTTR